MAPRLYPWIQKINLPLPECCDKTRVSSWEHSAQLWSPGVAAAAGQGAQEGGAEPGGAVEPGEVDRQVGWSDVNLNFKLKKTKKLEFKWNKAHYE